MKLERAGIFHPDHARAALELLHVRGMPRGLRVEDRLNILNTMVSLNVPKHSTLSRHCILFCILRSLRPADCLDLLDRMVRVKVCIFGARSERSMLPEVRLRPAGSCTC